MNDWLADWMVAGEGMAGSLYWQDLISLVQEIGFSTPYLVAASHIEVHNCELKKKAGNLCFSWFFHSLLNIHLLVEYVVLFSNWKVIMYWQVYICGMILSF